MHNTPDYAAIFDASPYPYLLIDPDLVIIGANRAYLQVTDSNSNIIGKALFDAFPTNPADPASTNAAEVSAAIARVITSREPHNTVFLRYAIPHRGAGGIAFEERFWSTIHTPVFNADGDVAYVAQNAIDVTDLYRFSDSASLIPASAAALAGTPADRAEHAASFNRAQMQEVMKRVLSEERIHLRDADRRKDEFLAMLAHELRNPLAPISAAAQLLRIPTLKPELIRKTSEVIGRQVSHMTSLIEDLLDVSRVTRGLIALDCERLCLRDIITDAVEQARPLIDSRRQQLSVRLISDLIELTGDKKRLVQVLSNLLNNAAKYTHETGLLMLTVTTDGPSVTISIEDNGIGIGPDLLPHVFDLFTQAERMPDRVQGGLGLGLALVRSLVALHGGSVAVSSPGKGLGATFSICVPRIVADAAGNNGMPDACDLARPERVLRLLVVDDNADAADMLGAFMESAGHQVSIEYEPIRAMGRARAEKPDVCLLDIGLPGMDGNQLARCLRLMPQTERATLIAVTGYGKEFDRDTAIAAGFDYYFVKPADPSMLLALLNRIHVA